MRLCAFQTTAYHLTNIFLHTLVTIVLFQTLNQLIKHFNRIQPDEIAFHTSILFAVHPIHSEAVANIAGRAEILMTLMLLSAVKLYLGGIELNYFDIYRTIAISVFTVLSLFSKEQGIMTLPICILIECTISSKSSMSAHRSKRSVIFPMKNTNESAQNLPKSKRKVRFANTCRIFGLVAFTMMLLLFRLHINGFKSPHFSTMDNPIAYQQRFSLRVINYMYIFLLNIWLLICPYQLCFDYSMGCINLIENSHDPRILVIMTCFIVLLIGIGLSLNYAPHNDKLMLFSIVFMLLTFLPSSNLLVTVGFILAERVLYLPSIGFCLFCAIIYTKLRKLSKFISHETYHSIALTIVLIATSKTMKRSAEWRSEMELYMSGLLVCPNNAKIHYNLGKIFADQGEYDIAASNYNNAIRLNPRYHHALNNLANIYLHQENLSKAEELLYKAVKFKPDFATAWMNLGITYMNQNKLKDAENSFKAAMRVKPRYVDCIYNIGLLYVKQNRKQLAAHAWRYITKVRPSHAQAWINLFISLDELGECSNVTFLADTALRYLSNYSAIQTQIAICYARMKNYTKAEAHMLKSIELMDKNVSNWINLAVLYENWGKIQRAIGIYSKVLRIEPGSETAKRSLSRLMSRKNVQSSNYHIVNFEK